MRALSSPPFQNYRVWWSLSDSKYAGTALFVKKCFQPKSVFFNLDKKGMSVSKICIVLWYKYLLYFIPLKVMVCEKLSYYHASKAHASLNVSFSFYVVVFGDLSPWLVLILYIHIFIFGFSFKA